MPDQERVLEDLSDDSAWLLERLRCDVVAAVGSAVSAGLPLGLAAELTADVLVELRQLEFEELVAGERLAGWPAED